MYQGDEAAQVFAKFYDLPLRETQITRDQFFDFVCVFGVSKEGVRARMAHGIDARKDECPHKRHEKEVEDFAEHGGAAES